LCSIEAKSLKPFSLDFLEKDRSKPIFSVPSSLNILSKGALIASKTFLLIKIQPVPAASISIIPFSLERSTGIQKPFESVL